MTNPQSSFSQRVPSAAPAWLLVTWLAALAFPQLVAQTPAVEEVKVAEETVIEAAPQGDRQSDEGTSASQSLTKAQGKPFLWRIETVPPSYLFGTIHVPDPRVLDFAPSVQQALQDVQEVWTEIDLTDTAALVRGMSSMRLPRGENLFEILPEDVGEMLTSYLEAQEVRPRSYRRKQIWAAILELATADKEMRKMMLSGLPLDMVVAQRAKKAGKRVGGLESFAEQTAVFQGFARKEQVELLRGTLASLGAQAKEGTRTLERMITSYARGDDADIKAVLDEQMGTEIEGVDPKLMKRLKVALLDVRDRRMTNRIVEQMEQRPENPMLFAVGTAHLLGPTSVVAQLRERGYAVTRIGRSFGPEDARARRAALTALVERQMAELETLLRTLRETREGAAGATGSAGG